MISALDMVMCSYHHRDMSKDEFKIILNRMGVSGAQMARWLGVSPLTVSRWRNGAVDITGPAALAIKALASGWRP